MTFQHQKKFYPHENAESIARMLNDTEKKFNDDYVWTYIVNPIPENPGYSLIEVYDEENEFAAYLTL